MALSSWMIGGPANLFKATGGCVNQSDILARVHHTNPATVASSALSLLGSLAIITPFLLWKDLRRSTARKILLLLAVSDFFTAVGYLAAGSMYYYYYDERGHLRNNHTDSYHYFCDVQAFMTTYFPITSFFWTTYLAVYFVVTLVFRLYHWSWRLLLFFNLSAWGIPLAVCSVAVGTGILGYGDVSSSSESQFRGAEDAAGWCFVSSHLLSNASSSNDYKQKRIFYLAMEAVCGKGWEVLSYLVVVVCYGLIFTSNRFFKCSTKKPEFYHNTALSNAQPARHIVSEALVKVDIKLLFIPLVFVFLRIWGTIRYFVSWDSSCYIWTEERACMSEHCFNYSYSPFLLAMQAFCDPLQGFGNAILFVCLSKPIRHRLLSSLELCAMYCCALCCRCTAFHRVRRRSGHGNTISNVTFDSSYEESIDSEAHDEMRASGEEHSPILEGSKQKPQYGSTGHRTNEDRPVNQ